MFPLSNRTNLHLNKLSIILPESIDVDGGIVESGYVQDVGAWTGADRGDWRGGWWRKVDTAAFVVANVAV